MSLNLGISVGPHLRNSLSTKAIMGWVLFALLFPCGSAVYFFGLTAVWLILTTTLGCIFFEAVFNFLAKKDIKTVFDGSAAVAGVLLALVLPPTLPLWIALIGSFFAMVIVKGLFGGLGFNFFNPALAARAFLLASWPVAMTTWVAPFSAITTATPLYLAESDKAVPSYMNLFLGNHAGSLGETSVLAILIGAGILLALRIIDWPAPTAFIGTVFILSYVLGHDPVFYALSGGLMIGAFFMATDYVTTPVTTKGRFIFGLGCGLITVVIRFYGGYPEGVNYSIIFMNMFTPVIDRHIRPTLFGKVKKTK